MSKRTEQFGIFFLKLKRFFKKDTINSLSLHITNRCNLRCLYCYTDAGQKQKKELNFEEIETILCKAKKLGAKDLYIIGSGEPLLHPSIFDIISFSDKLGFKVHLFTNGTVITRNVARKLFQHNVNLTFKLNSFDPDIQDRLCGRKKVYCLVGYSYRKDGEQLIVKIPKGLKNLINAYSSRKDMLNLETVITKINYSCIPKIAEFCKDNNLGILIETLIWKSRALKYSSSLNLTKKEYKKLYLKLSEILGKEFRRFQNSIYCIHADNLIIFENRDISSCLTGMHILGNIKNDSLKEILKVKEKCNLFKKGKSFNYFRNCKGREHYSIGSF